MLNYVRNSVIIEYVDPRGNSVNVVKNKCYVLIRFWICLFDINETYVFHAGTKKTDGKVLSNGGRVLGVTALGDSLESAITNAYAAVDKISWSHKYYRKDIGQKGLTYL